MSDIPSVKKRFAGNAVLYALVLGLQRVVGVLMLPVYTHYLTPADYGVLQLLDMTGDIAAILFTAGLSGGVARLYYRAADEASRKRVLSTALLLEAGLALIGSLLVITFAPELHRIVMRGAGSTLLLRIAAVNFSLSVLTAVPVVLLTVQHRALAYALIFSGKLILQVGLNLVFLVWMGMGVQGILMSTGISSLVFGGALAIWLLRQSGMWIDGGVFRQLLRFGLPSQVATSASFLLGFGDRFFLQRSHGEAQVGIYGLAYQFGFLVVQFSVAPFLQAWTPRRFEMASGPAPERDAENARSFFYLSLILVTVATGVGIFVRPLLGILSSEAFHSAYLYVPPILLAYVFHGWTLVAGFSIDYSGRTEYHAIAAWIAAATAVAAYALLIPPFGAMGAAFATVLGLGARLLLVLYFGARVFPLRYAWLRSTALLLPASASVIAALLVQRGDFFGDVASGLVILLLYIIATWLLVLQDEERRTVLAQLRAPGALLLALGRR